MSITLGPDSTYWRYFGLDAENLKHNGPDNISIKLTMSRYDSELDTVEAIRSSSSRSQGHHIKKHSC